MQEEDYIEQEPIAQQINVEENSGSDGGSLPNPNNSTPPNSEPPPMTNDFGEPVIINTTTIRVGTDYFKPKSESEVDGLVEQKRINDLQKKIFQLQYEANYGSLPKELVQEESSEENSEESIEEAPEVKEQLIPNSILPQNSETEDKESVDNTINLKELAGDDYQPAVNNNVTEGNIKDMPVPTEIASPTEETPLINLAQLASEEDTGSSEESAPIVKAPSPTPDTDADFQAVTEKIGAQGEKTQKHESSSRATKKAEEASVEPQNKKQSLAEVQHVDKIESKETPAFDTSAFVDMLMAKIIAITPKSEEEADEFKDNNKVHEVKTATSGQIQQKKTASVGPLETAAKERPNESGIASKVVKPLAKAPIGSKPKDLGIEKGMPKKKKTTEVEQPIQQNSQELEKQFKDNEITDEQLSKSNEPTFMGALETKNTAQEDSKNAPQQLRTEEEQSLLATQSGAKQEGKDDLLAMHQDRATILTNVQGEQENASSSYTAEEAKVATKINSIYQSTKTEVEGTLSRLDSRVSQLFDQGAAKAQQRFESYVALKMAAYKEERYDGFSGAVSWAYDAFAGLPDEVNQFFVDGRHLYIETMQQTIQRIADLVAQELTAAKQRVQAGRQEVADYVESLPDDLKKVGQKTAAEINRDFDELNTKVDEKQGELIDSLAQKYIENVAEVDGRIEEMKTANRGLIDIALDSVSGVIATILEVKNSLLGILSAAMDAINAIILDPIGFLSNLISGVGQGISNFMTKIDDYLTTGFVEWLTGAMSGVGIEMPEDIFSLEGIFSITTQALGMTWDFIRERAVGVLGERAVGTIEESFEIFQILRTDGMGGAWEYLKDQFGDLQETIMGSITGMLISEVVEAGVKYLLAMLTPAGAFVKAAMMIVDVAKFFIQQGSQIMELVDAFVQSVSAIAAGSVGKVAEMIERALSLSVPLLIGLFTSLLGLGDLAAKVQKIFKKITGKITGAIDGFIEKAGAWFKDKKGRRKERKDKKNKEKEDKDNKNESDKDSKEDKDKRSDQQKKSDLKQGMKLGAAVVNNEDLNQQQVKVDLNKLELKYQLDELNVKLTTEKETLQTWILSGEIENYRKTKEIERKGGDGIFRDIKEVFTLAGEKHTLSVEYLHERYEVYMASDKNKLDARLAPFQETVERYRGLFAQKESQEQLTEEEEYFLLELEDMLKGSNSVPGLNADTDRFKQKINAKGPDKLNTKNRKAFFQEVEEWVDNSIKKIIDLATSDDFKLDDLSPEALQEAAEALEQEQQQQLKLSTIKDLFPNVDLSGLDIDNLLKNISQVQMHNAFEKLEAAYSAKGKDIQGEIDKLTRKFNRKEFSAIEKAIENGTQALLQIISSFGEEVVVNELAKLKTNNNHLNLVRKELSKKVNIKYIDYTKDQKEMTEEQLKFSQEVILEGNHLLEYRENKKSISNRTIAAVELRGIKSDLLFGGSDELFVSGGTQYTYEDSNGKKKRTKDGDKASSLKDLTHQVFEAGNHHGNRASDTEVHIFERLIEFLSKNKDNISPKNTIRIFVRYDACPSCQSMMYKIKQQADSGDERFASLRGVVLEVIHAHKNVFNKIV